MLLRRTIDNQGKSRGWINGTPATATQLRALGAVLVDIYGQHAWQSLLQADAMRGLLDGYGRIASHDIARLWQQWQQASQQLQRAQEGQAHQQAEHERLQWQIGEVARLNPGEGEWETLNDEQQRLAHAKELLDAAEGSVQDLEHDETGALHAMHSAMQRLNAQRAIAPEFGEWADLLESSHAQAQEVVRNLHASLGRVDLDPARLQQLDQRMAEWLALARRFKLAPEALPATWQAWQQQLAALEQAHDLQALQHTEAQAQAAYTAAAQQLTAQRQAAAQRLSQAITAAMQQLGMQGGSFAAEVQAAAPSAHGSDAVEFLVAGHAGSSLRAVSKVASGGELSRIALAIAVTTSQLGQAHTLIFDEVDAGIGGATAHTVGGMMRQLGHDRQVLAVTHLAQVAACAHHHLQVRKEADGKASQPPTSRVCALDEAARVQEIARMLGGDAASATSMAHASEMLASAAKPA